MSPRAPQGTRGLFFRREGAPRLREGRGADGETRQSGPLWAYPWPCSHGTACCACPARRSCELRSGAGSRRRLDAGDSGAIAPSPAISRSESRQEAAAPLARAVRPRCRRAATWNSASDLRSRQGDGRELDGGFARARHPRVVLVHLNPQTEDGLRSTIPIRAPPPECRGSPIFNSNINGVRSGEGDHPDLG